MGRNKKDAAQDVLTLYNQMQEDETIERGKEEIRTTLDEIASAKEVLSSVMVELSEAKQKMESTKIALIATQKSTENIVSRICNTIVKASFGIIKLELSDYEY